MEGYVIRRAHREDCAVIIRLIKELARFENMAEGPRINEHDLQREGFDSPHPSFKCFVAELTTDEQKPVIAGKGEIVGYAIYYPSFSTWNGRSMYLEDLCVTKDHRAKGIGSALFDRVVKETYDLGCIRLDFTVLNWNPATEFYKRKGAIDMTLKENWHHYRLYGEMFEQIANGSKHLNTML